MKHGTSPLLGGFLGFAGLKRARMGEHLELRVAFTSLPELKRDPGSEPRLSGTARRGAALEGRLPWSCPGTWDSESVPEHFTSEGLTGSIPQILAEFRPNTKAGLTGMKIRCDRSWPRGRTEGRKERAGPLPCDLKPSLPHCGLEPKLTLVSSCSVSSPCKTCFTWELGRDAGSHPIPHPQTC